MSLRSYFEVAGSDGSRVAEQVATQRSRVAARLASVDRVVAVISGKGGVGKSHVTAALALGIARAGGAVGVLDADLQSPTVARILGARVAGPLPVRADGVVPALGTAGVRVMSVALLLDEGRALRWMAAAGETHVWRGAMETGILREFLGDVAWGALAVLLVDMPPDAARLAELAALVPTLTGALAVTLPTAESEQSVARALDAARAAGVPILGLVENMSGHACAACGALAPLFEGEAGARLAAANGIPLLVRLPFAREGLEAVAERLGPVTAAVLAAGAAR